VNCRLPSFLTSLSELSYEPRSLIESQRTPPPLQAHWLAGLLLGTQYILIPVETASMSCAHRSVDQGPSRLGVPGPTYCDTGGICQPNRWARSRCLPYRFFRLECTPPTPGGSDAWCNLLQTAQPLAENDSAIFRCFSRTSVWAGEEIFWEQTGGLELWSSCRQKG